MKLANRNAFLIVGCLESAWAPMVPYVKQGFGLDEAQLGMLLLCTGLGSVLALPVAGPLCKRFGAKWAVYANGLMLALALAVVSATISLWLTAVMLVLFGMCTVQIDVAANVNGVTLEEKTGKNLMSGFHGGYSLGTLLGSCAMSLLLTSGMGILPSALIVLAASLAYFLWGCKALLGKGELDTAPHPDSGQAARHGWFRIPPLVIVVGLVCFVLYSSEGAVMSWSAVFVNQERGIDLRHAGYFYSAFAVCMTVMRLSGNSIVNRLGARLVVVSGAVLVSAGFLVVALVPSIVATIAGFAMIGIGAANIVPQLMSYAGHLKGMAVQNIVSVITALGYSGILLGPVVIGFCADHFGLPATFAGIGCLVVVVVFVLRWLFSRQTKG